MLLIDFSGTDGSGKTTALKYLVEKVQSMGLSVVETREVGNPHIPSCVKMRELVLDPNNNLSGEAMELIFSAMRFENTKFLEKLAESDSPPDLVINDRGFLDHAAYTAHNVSEDFVVALYENLVFEQTYVPDAAFYFDVNTETALKRRVRRGTGMDVIEMKGIEFQNKVRDSFEKYIDKYKQQYGLNTIRINANQDIDTVRGQLDKVLESLMTTMVKES